MLCNGKNSKVHSISMSWEFFVLTVSHHTVRLIGRDRIICSPLVHILNLLVCLLFWWLDGLIVGEDAERFLHGEDQQVYHRSTFIFLNSIFLRSVVFVRRIRLSRGIWISRMYNAYWNWGFTRFHNSHTRYFVSEMMYESHHQPLKHHWQEQTSPIPTYMQHKFLSLGTVFWAFSTRWHCGTRRRWKEVTSCFWSIESVWRWYRSWCRLDTRRGIRH